MNLVTVMTLNLRYDNPNDGDNAWKHRVPAIVAAIEAAQPLFIGTQEGLLPMLQTLLKALPGYAMIGQGRCSQDPTDNEYNAIFYRKDRMELLAQGQFWLSDHDEDCSNDWGGACPRICTWGDFQLNGGAELLVYNTHLDCSSVEARNNGIALIWQQMAQNMQETGAPAVLTGDMNADPTDPWERTEGSDQVAAFLSRQTAINGETADLTDIYGVIGDKRSVGRTYHGFKGGFEGSPCDFIAVTPGIDPVSVLVDRRQFYGRYPSDHYPVVGQLLVR